MSAGAPPPGGGIRDVLPALAAAFAGVTVVFWRILAGDLEVFGETRLCAYFLEHGMRALWWGDYPFSFWGAPFYAPYPAALTFSDNLIGAAPVYWFFRLFCGPDRSFFLWQFSCVALTCASLIWVMRRWGGGWWLSLAAAAVYCYGFPRLYQLGHPQLYAAFYAPWVLHGLWSFVRRPSWQALALVSGGIALQVLAAIYLGWFLLFGSALFLALWFMASPREHFRAVMDGVKRSPVAWMGVPAASGLMLVLFLRPYLRAMHDTGGWDFDKIIAPFLPTWRDYFVAEPPAGGPAGDEHGVAPGWTSLAVFALGCALWFRRRGGDPGLRRAAGLGLLACAVLTLLVMRYGTFSPWRLVFLTVPGAGAMRAVSRVWTVSFLFGLPAAFLLVDEFLRRTVPRRAGLLISVLLAGGCFLELALPAARLRPSGDRSLCLRAEEREELRDILRQGDIACVALPPAPRNDFHANIDVMWTAMETRVPVVNGSSGQEPPGFHVNVQALRAVDVLRNLGGAVTGSLQLVFSRGLKTADPWLEKRDGVSWREGACFRTASVRVPVDPSLLYPHYRIGELVSPAGTNADFIGWNPDVEWMPARRPFLWSVSRTSRIFFWLEGDEPRAKVQDRSSLTLSMLPNGAQRYVVSLNGQELGRGRLADLQLKSLRFSVPAGALRWNAPNELAITTPDIRQLPPPDNRLVGIAFFGARFVDPGGPDGRR